MVAAAIMAGLDAEQGSLPMAAALLSRNNGLLDLLFLPSLILLSEGKALALSLSAALFAAAGMVYIY